MKGLSRKLFRDLRTMGIQVATIAMLIIGGLSVLVSSWSSFLSLRKLKELFYEQYRFADIFSEVVRAPVSLVTEITQLPGVDIAEGRIVKEGIIDVSGQVEPALGRFISWSGEHQALNLIYLRQGRMPQPSLQPEVVVHEAFAVAHHLKVGDSVKVLLGGQQRTLLVAGIGLSPEFVYALSPVAPLPDDKHFGVFWMREKDLDMLTGMTGAFNSLQLKVSKQASNAETKRRIDLLLQPFGNIQSYDRSLQLSNLFVEDEIRQQRIMSVVMPTIFLTVASFILNVILSRVVTLHRPQIATLKSLGYSARTLTFHYFQLVTLILVTGILPSIAVGALIGKWYAGLYEDFFRFPSIDFSLSLNAVLLCFVAGLVPGWSGAAGALVRVFSLQPAEALRPPNPPIFHKMLLERFAVFKNAGFFSKMIIRSLLFHPFRLLMSILGMALALAILINGSFWKDVVDFVMDRQFHQMRREDLSVRLLHPKSADVFAEINRIPGVIMVEGERQVPVRLQFKNLKKDIGLLGWQQSATLSRVLEKNGNAIEPVRGGLLLSRYFESEFKIKVGDTVNIKSLQGAQKEFNVPVFGFVDDLVGQQAYAVKNDIHRWLNEKPVVDTLQLKIDPGFAEKIYVALKQRPAVAAISIRRLLLKSFSETVANMIVTFTFILYFFAVAIAGAIIYNSARIGFSEKGWELASLRILGFDVLKTFQILFIEIGIQVLVSLIPGLLLGYGLSFLSTNLIHNETFNFPLVINPATYAAAVLIILLTFFISGFFLYRKVSQLDFSEALKARD